MKNQTSAKTAQAAHGSWLTVGGKFEKKLKGGENRCVSPGELGRRKETHIRKKKKINQKEKRLESTSGGGTQNQASSSKILGMIGDSKHAPGRWAVSKGEE